MSNVWAYVQQNINPGQTVKDGAYRVLEVTEKRFQMERVASGKSVNISRKMCESTMARLQAGERLAYQAAGSKGGISYTVAIVAGVEAALEGLMVRDSESKRFILAQGADVALREVA